MTTGFMDQMQNEGDWNMETAALLYCVSPTESTRSRLMRNVDIIFWPGDITAGKFASISVWLRIESKLAL